MILENEVEKLLIRLNSLSIKSKIWGRSLKQNIYVEFQKMK